MGFKVLVVCDKHGKIISLGRPTEVGDEPSEIPGIEVDPEPGQFVHYIDVPAELEKLRLLDLHNEFRMDLKGKRPRFVRVQSSTERYREK